MAKCNVCEKTVSCSCSLYSGKCIGCYSKSVNNTSTPIANKTYNNVPANTEFDEILGNKHLDKLERLRRINFILESKLAEAKNNNND